MASSFGYRGGRIGGRATWTIRFPVWSTSAQNTHDPHRAQNAGIARQVQTAGLREPTYIYISSLLPHHSSPSSFLHNSARSWIFVTMDVPSFIRPLVARQVKTIDMHTTGEPTRIVYEGFPDIS